MLQTKEVNLAFDVSAISASDLISLSRASEISGIRHECLRVFAQRGRIKAVKIGSDWMTTPAALEEYMNTPRRRGRPPLIKKPE